MDVETPSFLMNLLTPQEWSALIERVFAGSHSFYSQVLAVVTPFLKEMGGEIIYCVFLFHLVLVISLFYGVNLVFQLNCLESETLNPWYITFPAIMVCQLVITYFGILNMCTLQLFIYFHDNR